MTARRAAPKDTLERLLSGPMVWIGLAPLTAFALGPFIWMFLTSLKDRQELYATPLQYLPVHPTFENYIDAWTSPVTPFGRFFLNSLWVCSVTSRDHRGIGAGRLCYCPLSLRRTRCAAAHLSSYADVSE